MLDTTKGRDIMELIANRLIVAQLQDCRLGVYGVNESELVQSKAVNTAGSLDNNKMTVSHSSWSCTTTFWKLYICFTSILTTDNDPIALWEMLSSAAWTFKYLCCKTDN